MNKTMLVAIATGMMLILGGCGEDSVSDANTTELVSGLNGKWKDSTGVTWVFNNRNLVVNYDKSDINQSSSLALVSTLFIDGSKKVQPNNQEVTKIVTTMVQCSVKLTLHTNEAVEYFNANPTNQNSFCDTTWILGKTVEVGQCINFGSPCSKLNIPIKGIFKIDGNKLYSDNNATDNSVDSEGFPEVLSTEEEDILTKQ